MIDRLTSAFGFIKPPIIKPVKRKRKLKKTKK